MIPLISFDAVVNVYLTILFLIPFKNLYSFKHMPRSKANVRLRMVAMRTFVGSLCTTTSSVVNLAVLSALKGEPGWVCLMCCNSDILFSAIVVQWVTSRDNAGTVGSSISSPDAKVHRELGHGHAHSFTHDETGIAPPSTATEISLVTSKVESRGTEMGGFEEDYDASLDIASKSGKVATSVIVTTTIRHESEPRDIDLELQSHLPRRNSMYSSSRGVDVLSLGRPPNGPGRYVTGSQTIVTGGSAP
ncbi:hypothetical protein ESCO_003615 [Escovopsis weberi]|uniref:Uncharacterized protein n=1 Tax=Escovopsis weberi TaxID=150374 RepID=A0A0M8N8K9_ESCWE|nr:hypothetical protein ESCO_003615 [Escovopsis weberi]